MSSQQPPRERRIKRPDSGWSISPVLAGLLLSIALAVLAVITPSTKVALGLCAALLGTLLAIVYDLYRRVERRVEVEDYRSSLLAAMRKAPWLLEELTELAATTDGALANERNAELFDVLIQAKVGETNGYLQDLKRGHIRVPVDEDTPMSNQIDQVGEGGMVFATTIPEIDNGWWRSPAGEEYLERNRAAKERGVTIQRIILWETLEGTEGEALGQELAEVVEAQRTAGIEIRFAKRSKLPDKLRTNIAIYDGQTYNDVVFNCDGCAIYKEYYFNERDAQKAVADFKLLWGMATIGIPPELAPWLAPNGNPSQTPEVASAPGDDGDPSSPPATPPA
jgi:hypothetical protein